MRLRFVVRGRVQGVGFRWFVARRAERLGLAGQVRNLADGSVEVLAEGPPAAMSELEAALGAGPSFARVEFVDKAEISDEVILPTPFAIVD